MADLFSDQAMQPRRTFQPESHVCQAKASQLPGRIERINSFKMVTVLDGDVLVMGGTKERKIEKAR